MDLNPLSNVVLCAHLNEFVKVIKLAMVQFMGLVEDERTLTFMKIIL
jgi:hypothetical protein